MHAVVVREVGDPSLIDESGGHVEATVVPRLRQAQGIVSAFWTSDGAGGTLNILVFESEETARAALERVRAAPRPPFIRLEDARVHRVLASI